MHLFLYVDVVGIVGDRLVVRESLSNGLLGSGRSCLGWLEQVGRLTVDLAVHDLLETTHDNPGVHSALFAQLGAVGVVDGLANLPHVLNPVKGAFHWAWSVKAVNLVLVRSFRI